jgi:hypothetical protein
MHVFNDYSVTNTLIKQKPGYSRKMFWTLEFPFKTGFTAFYIKFEMLT